MSYSWFHTHISQRTSIQTGNPGNLTDPWWWVRLYTSCHRHKLLFIVTNNLPKVKGVWEHLGEMGHTQRSVTLLANPLILCKKCGYVLHKSQMEPKGPLVEPRVHLFGQGETEPMPGTFTFLNEASYWHIFNLGSVKFGTGNPWFGLKMGCLVLWNACLVIMFYNVFSR
jgi:hypothetical protein